MKKNSIVYIFIFTVFTTLHGAGIGSSALAGRSHASAQTKEISPMHPISALLLQAFSHNMKNDTTKEQEALAQLQQVLASKKYDLNAPITPYTDPYCKLPVAEPSFEIFFLCHAADRTYIPGIKLLIQAGADTNKCRHSEHKKLIKTARKLIRNETIKPVRHKIAISVAESVLEDDEKNSSVIK